MEPLREPHAGGENPHLSSDHHVRVLVSAHTLNIYNLNIKKKALYKENVTPEH